MRTNEPYSCNPITEEEVQKLKELINRDNTYLYVHGFKKLICEDAEPIVDRMWQEIQILRSVLEKQIY